MLTPAGLIEMPEQPSQRRLAAIMVADIVGYSRMMEVDEAGTLDTWKERRRDTLEPVVFSHGGRIAPRPWPLPSCECLLRYET